MEKTVEFILVGQGIAGTTLAWHLKEAGLSFAVLDRAETVTSSRIAAGLLTPITGKRLVQTQSWKEYWKHAVEFYRCIEQKTGASFFFEKPMLRLFQNEDEKALFHKKRCSHEFGRCVEPSIEIPLSLKNCELGGFEMSGGQLQVAQYLDVSREFFAAIDSYRQVDLDVQNDIQYLFDAVAIPKLDLVGRRIIFCQGFQAMMPEVFSRVKFNPSKGEILDIAIEEFSEERVLHKGFWLTRQPDGDYRAGANYEWQDLSTKISAEGRRWVTTQLDALLDREYEVLAQQAAVRPTMHDFQPVVGMHPDFPRVGMFNGLGSKGSLMAPRLASILIDHISHEGAIPPGISLARWYV